MISLEQHNAILQWVRGNELTVPEVQHLITQCKPTANDQPVWMTIATDVDGQRSHPAPVHFDTNLIGMYDSAGGSLYAAMCHARANDMTPKWFAVWEFKRTVTIVPHWMMRSVAFSLGKDNVMYRRTRRNKGLIVAGQRDYLAHCIYMLDGKALADPEQWKAAYEFNPNDRPAQE